MNYQTLQVRFQAPVCFLQLHRPEANNTINELLLQECHQVLDICEKDFFIVVLEGLPEIFSLGADFNAIDQERENQPGAVPDPEPLYRLWMRLATGPWISIAHVRGKVNAGGIGFVAACDIVLSDETARFSLSELLFGLFPACVLPFLIRRVGVQKAHYLTLMTHAIDAAESHRWGLSDACEANSTLLLRKHLVRLSRLSKPAVVRYKKYIHSMDSSLESLKPLAMEGYREIFSDSGNLEKISRFVKGTAFPWES